MLNAYQTVHLEKLDSFHPSQAQSQLAVATSLYDSDILMAAVLGAGWESHLAMESPHTKNHSFHIFSHIIYYIYYIIYTHTIYNAHTHYIYKYYTIVFHNFPDENGDLPLVLPKDPPETGR